MAERESYAPGTFCWADLGTTDAAAAKEFYARVFGWEAVDTPVGDEGTYTMFRLDGRDVAALYELDEEQRELADPALVVVRVGRGRRRARRRASASWAARCWPSRSTSPRPAGRRRCGTRRARS